MLSFPLITPRDDSTLWPSHPTHRLSSLDGPLSTAPDTNAPPHPHHHQRRPHSQLAHASARSTLASLAADENTIIQRKMNVRRFGAGWIRPPGVPKTYQATMDEAAEREDQEILARREQVLADLAAAQEADELAAQREAAAEEGEEERDLDDEVPEAEAEDSEDEIGSESGSEGVERTEGEMTFNEDSFIEGSMVQADVEQMLEMEEAEMAGVLQDERDLDDDVPEAGSYQHTDTELEDESSEIEEMSFEQRRSAGRMSSGRRMRRSGGAPAAARASMFSEDGSSMLGGSSFVGSSPAAARGPGLGNAFRNRLMRPPAPPRGG